MPSELEVQIRQTRAFIATRPISISLIPHAMQRDGSGGKRLTPTAGARPPQTMRFVETAESATRNTTEVGEQWQQSAMLIALPDAGVAINDVFEWDGVKWKVEDILFPNGYEKRVAVVQYGR